jgi:dolichyl-phosphate-mannose-protein mannosyltransferase
VTSPYFLVMWSSVTPAIDRFSFPPSLGRCKGVLNSSPSETSNQKHSGHRDRTSILDTPPEHRQSAACSTRASLSCTLTNGLEQTRTVERPRSIRLASGLRVPRWPARGTWLPSLLQVLPLAIAAFYCGGFLLAAYFRVTFPYPMGVSESESIQSVRQIASGRSLYAAPTLEFVGPIYTPLYFYVSALAARVLGVGLPTLRLVSLVASVGSACLIGYLVWSEARVLIAAVGAAALFVGSTQFASSTLDLARTDALSVFCLLAAIALAHSARSAGSSVWLAAASGAVTALAVLTKQTTAVLAAALLVPALLSRQPQRAASYLAGLVGVVALAGVSLTAAYGNWPWVYVTELPRGHSIDQRFIGSFWSSDVLPGFASGLLLGALFVVRCARRREWERVRFWTIVPVSMLALAWMSRVNVASSSNVVAPAFASLAVWFGLGIGEAVIIAKQSGFHRGYVLALLSVGLALVRYNPRQASPLRSDVWAGERVVATISNQPGTVYSPVYAEFVHQAGKGDDAFATNLMELMGSFGGGVRPEGVAWMDLYVQALRERRLDQLLLDPDYASFLARGAQDAGYVDTGALFGEDDIINQWQSPYIQMPHVWLPRERVNPVQLPP